MKTKGFKGALLSTLMIIALMAPAITTISLLSVSPVSASPTYEVIVRAGENSFVNDINPPPPWIKYKAGDNAPLMVAKEIGLGAVVAAGFGHTLRNDRWNDLDIPAAYRHFDGLLDNVFRWMRPGTLADRDNVLWYKGYGVYNDNDRCSALVAALRDNYGYKIGTSTLPFTTSLLAPYDILVIPQLELPVGFPGGNPDLLPDSDVDNIVAWVNGGGGVFIVDGADTFGHNYCRVQNKILKALGLDMMFIQSDELRDPTYTWSGNEWEMYADLDNTTWIGSAYENRWGTKRVGVYMPCTLAPRDNYEVGLRVSPSIPIFQQGFPGGKLIYDVEVYALGWLTDNIELTVENTWPAVLKDNLFLNIQSDNSRRTTLTVTIPSSAVFGTQNTITVTATSKRDGTKFKKENCRAVVAARIGPPVADAWVSAAQPKDNFGGQETVLWVGSVDNENWYMSGLEPHWNMRTWMRFDLRGIPSVIPPGNWNSGNLTARLYAFCWGIHGAWGRDVQCYGSNNDAWEEFGTNWNNQPGLDNALGITTITTNDGWVSWDITSFIRSELAKGENLATLCLRAVKENARYPDNFACEFYAKGNKDENTHLPFITIGYDVDAWITPTYGEALPGGTISYGVKMINMGSLADNYTLTVENTKTWPITLPGSVLNVQPNEVRRVNLDVQILSSANPCAENDNVRVTVKSGNYPENAKDKDNCIAHPSINRIMPAKEDSSTRGRGIIPLENSVWGLGDHESGRGNVTQHVENTMWIGRERVFAGPAFLYEAATEALKPDNGQERGWLKFDLRGIPSLENLENKRVTLNLFSPPRFLPTVHSVENGGALVQVYSVGDDSWSEDTITWRNQPSIDNFLDQRNVPEEYAGGKWYSWDVTSFVRAQYQGDNVASFCLIDLGEYLGWLHTVHFDMKELVLENQWPYLEILSEDQLPDREVRVYMGPVVRNGPSGGSMENYIVTVVNKGKLADTYTLENKDNLGWTLSLDNISLSVPAGENKQTILHVTIPGGQEGKLDNIYVTATGTGVSDRAVCFAYQMPLTAQLIGLGGPWPKHSPYPEVVCGGLYHIEVKIDNLLVQQLVVKFKTYGGTPQGENIWWSGGANVLKTFASVKHPITTVKYPMGLPVEKAELYLRSGDNERFLSSYTVTQSALKARFLEILGSWFKYPELQACLKAEFLAILGQWFKAPP